MTRDTRERITTTATTLFRRQGWTGTGLAQIAAESGTGVGSIYHFFGGGKDALTAEVVRDGGRAYGAYVAAVLADGPGDPVDALGHAFVRAAEDLAASDYADACPIATIALEVASTHEPLRVATAEVFASWIEALSAFCRGVVDDEAEARDLAYAVLTMLEGAFVLARSSRSREPLLAAGRGVVRLAEGQRDRVARGG
ncbi:TetR/AcrR family transcriptional regulator [Marmoricola endophyticus]|nr:TetR/AcrR family transcriptional regulator [Marmoricola endophyticus]